jgi:hypothetical protein
MLVWRQAETKIWMLRNVWMLKHLSFTVSVLASLVSFFLGRICSVCRNLRCWGSVVGIATTLRAGRIGHRIPVVGVLLTSKHARLALGPTKPLLQSVPGVKRPEHDVDHLPPSSTEVETEWSYTSSPPLRLHVRDICNFFVLFISESQHAASYCGRTFETVQ